MAEHRPTDIGNAFGGYQCACGGAWLDSYGSCTAGGREGEPIDPQPAPAGGEEDGDVV